MAATVIIPARLASTRFPEKVLAADTGRPLVQHVVDQVRRCRRVNRVIVAADHPRIVSALAPWGVECVLTRADHPSGTDRLAEVARGLSDELIVNVQGDEPEVPPELIDGLIAAMESGDAPMGTVAVPYPADADPADPNLVKVVCDSVGRALYFSRSGIPHARDGGPCHRLLHVGLYAYRRMFLLQYAAWPPSPLEQAEKLEQLRALEHGAAIRVIVGQHPGGGIDTPEQYARFVQRFRAARSGASPMLKERVGQS